MKENNNNFSNIGKPPGENEENINYQIMEKKGKR